MFAAWFTFTAILVLLCAIAIPIEIAVRSSDEFREWLDAVAEKVL